MYKWMLSKVSIPLDFTEKKNSTFWQSPRRKYKKIKIQTHNIIKEWNRKRRMKMKKKIFLHNHFVVLNIRTRHFAPPLAAPTALPYIERYTQTIQEPKVHNNTRSKSRRQHQQQENEKYWLYDTLTVGNSDEPTDQK